MALRFARIASQAPPAKRHSVAAVRSGSGGLEDLDVERLDAAPERVAVEAKKLGCPDLIAAGGCQGRGQQRLLHLADDAIVEPGRRQLAAEAAEIAAEITLDQLGQVHRLALGVVEAWRQ